jgi:hypothetical protein
LGAGGRRERYEGEGVEGCVWGGNGRREIRDERESK